MPYPSSLPRLHFLDQKYQPDHHQRCRSEDAKIIDKRQHGGLTYQQPIEHPLRLRQGLDCAQSLPNERLARAVQRRPILLILSLV